MFCIKFNDEPLEYPFDDVSIPAASGTLVLGKAIEDFLANLSLWTKSDYESHWTRELKALFEGRSKVALIVSYNDPKASWNMEIWRVYRDGEWVHFQNQLLWYDSLPNGFEVSKMSDYRRRGEPDLRVGCVNSGHRVVSSSLQSDLRQ